MYPMAKCHSTKQLFLCVCVCVRVSACAVLHFRSAASTHCTRSRDDDTGNCLLMT